MLCRHFVQTTFVFPAKKNFYNSVPSDFYKNNYKLCPANENMAKPERTVNAKTLIAQRAVHIKQILKNEWTIFVLELYKILIIDRTGKNWTSSCRWRTQSRKDNVITRSEIVYSCYMALQRIPKWPKQLSAGFTLQRFTYILWKLYATLDKYSNRTASTYRFSFWFQESKLSVPKNKIKLTLSTTVNPENRLTIINIIYGV